MIIVVDGQSKAERGPDRALEEDEKDQDEWDEWDEEDEAKSYVEFPQPRNS